MLSRLSEEREQVRLGRRAATLCEVVCMKIDAASSTADDAMDTFDALRYGRHCSL